MLADCGVPLHESYDLIGALPADLLTLEVTDEVRVVHLGCLYLDIYKLCII